MNRSSFVIPTLVDPISDFIRKTDFDNSFPGSVLFTFRLSVSVSNSIYSLYRPTGALHLHFPLLPSSRFQFAFDFIRPSKKSKGRLRLPAVRLGLSACFVSKQQNKSNLHNIIGYTIKLHKRFAGSGKSLRCSHGSKDLERSGYLSTGKVFGQKWPNSVKRIRYFVFSW